MKHLLFTFFLTSTFNVVFANNYDCNISVKMRNSSKFPYNPLKEVKFNVGSIKSEVVKNQYEGIAMAALAVESGICKKPVQFRDESNYSCSLSTDKSNTFKVGETIITNYGRLLKDALLIAKSAKTSGICKDTVEIREK